MVDFYEVLEQILKEENLTVSELSRKTGVPYTTLKSIITRKTKNIALEVAMRISKSLDIPLIDLNEGLGTQAKENNSKEISKEKISLSNKEENLLNDFNKLNEVGQNKVIEYTNDLTEQPKYVKWDRSMIKVAAAHNDKLMDKNISEEEYQVELEKVYRDIERIKNEVLMKKFK